MPKDSLFPKGDVLERLLDETGLAVVDIGARGKPVRQIRPFAPYVRLYACEPEPAEAERLAADLAREAPWREVTLIPQAIAGSEGSRTLHITSRPGMSSLLPPNVDVLARYASPPAEVVDTVEVPTIPLDAAATRYGFEDACFLKVDTQGTELEILRSGERLLREVAGVMVETNFHPFYAGQSLFADIDVYLRGLDFVLVDMRRTALRSSGFQRRLYSRRQVVWAHCLYLRRLDALLDSDPASARRRLVRYLALALAFEYLDLAQAAVAGATEVGLFSADEGGELAAGVKGYARRLTRRRLRGLDERQAEELLARAQRD